MLKSSLILAKKGSEMETLASIIDRVAQRLHNADLFYGHGTDNPVDESHWLVLYVVGLAVDAPVEDYTMPLKVGQLEQIEKLTAQRIEQRRPLAYLLNSSWFAGLEFFVDQRVLVPRSPIAELILNGFCDWLQPQQVGCVLDLCTGSGCIGIASSYSFPDASVVLSDISCEALDVARINIDKHHVAHRVSTCQSDVFASIEGRFDLIVSNPPYVDQADMDALHVEFLHEPSLGLAAGNDGLAIVDRILIDAHLHLSRDGILVVEVGNTAATLEAAYPDLPFLWLEFECGGTGVFVLTAEELAQHREAITQRTF